MSQSPTPQPASSGGRFAKARASLDVFADANYRWYWVGSFAYYMGLNMELTARSQLALDLTGQAFFLGLAAFSQGLPSSLMSIVGGALADRVPKRKLLFGVQVVLAGSGIIMFALLATGLISAWQVLFFGALRGFTTGLSLPACLSMVSDVVPEKQFLKAYGIYYVANNSMRIGGPAIAGILIGITGGTTIPFFVIAVAHVVGLLALIPVQSNYVQPRKGPKTSLLQDLKGTYDFMRSTQTIMIQMGAAMGITFFSQASLQMLPIFAQNVFHRGGGPGLATLQAAQGIGGVVGSMLIASLGGIKKKSLMLLIVGMLQAINLIIFANVPWFEIAVIDIVAVGVTAACYTTLNSTLFQLNSAPEMRGRATSLYLLGNAAQPLGVLPIGYFSDEIGAPATMTIAGGLLLSYMVGVFFLAPSFRKEEY